MRQNYFPKSNFYYNNYRYYKNNNYNQYVSANKSKNYSSYESKRKKNNNNYNKNVNKIKNNKLLNKKRERTKERKDKKNNKNVVQFFSPNNPNKLDNIIAKLESAKTSLDIAMYTLTNIDLINTIMKCHNKKVKIRIILDYKMTKKYSWFLKELLKNDILIKTNDDENESMHHKFAIIDNKYVFNGSLNWSQKGVSKNHENILFLENKEIAEQFASQFEDLWNKFNNAITLDDIDIKGKFYYEKKYLPKRYYRNYNQYKNYFDKNGYQQDQFIEDIDDEDDFNEDYYDYYDEIEEEEEEDDEDSEEEESEVNDYSNDYSYNDDYGDNYDDYDDY